MNLLDVKEVCFLLLARGLLFKCRWYINELLLQYVDVCLK